MPAKEADQFFSPFYYGQTNPPKKPHPHGWRSFPFTAPLSQITFLSSHLLAPPPFWPKGGFKTLPPNAICEQDGF
jgi:hypothetical protein